MGKVETWYLWAEFKSSIDFLKMLRKIRRTPALSQFLSSSDETSKILEFKFECDPKEFAKTFPKSSMKEVSWGKEGSNKQYKI